MTTPALAEPFIAAGAAVAFLVLFCYRKRTKPPAAMSGVKLYMLGGYHQALGKLVI